MESNFTIPAIVCAISPYRDQSGPKLAISTVQDWPSNCNNPATAPQRLPVSRLKDHNRNSTYLPWRKA